MNIEAILDAIYTLNTNSKKLFIENIDEVSFKKGDFIFKSNRKEDFVYFVKKGIVRAYAQKDKNDVTFWFGSEGSTLISMKNYVERCGSYENIEALEDVILFRIKSQLLFDFYQQNIDFANWGRKFAEKELIKTEERLIDSQFKSAKERYLALTEQHPTLIQRVQLGYIASFLGITQVSLSRIRAEIVR